MKQLRIAALILLVVGTTSMVVAQEQPPAPRSASAVTDETFDLNITERHIQEKDFQASTAVEVGTGNGKDVRVVVGVALSASTIDVKLRNVTGTVRFRGSLQRVLDILYAPSSVPPPRDK